MAGMIPVPEALLEGKSGRIVCFCGSLALLRVK
jgi:hypothetical protein